MDLVNDTKVTPALLVKLCSIAVHAEELTSGDGHPFDSESIKSLCGDADVVKWISQMRDMGLAPVKRNNTTG